jgi:hypothetical protein
VLHHIDSNPEIAFKFAIINTNKGLEGGLDFHPIAVDNATGCFLRNISLELKNIPRSRIYNTAFW